MRRRNRIVKIINISAIIIGILLVLLIIFLIKNKKYEINIKDVTSIKSDITIIDCEYYDELLNILNKGKYKKTDKQYGGMHKKLVVVSKSETYEFYIYEDKNIITYKKNNKIYVSDDSKYVKKIVEAINKYDYSLVKLEPIKIEYYKNKYDFDTKYNVNLKGNNTILLTINKNVSNIRFYQIFNDESEILISDAKKLVANDKIAYYIDIDKVNNVRIEVIDDYKTNIYKSYIEDDKMKFIEITKEPEIVLNPSDLELLVGDEVTVSLENFDGLIKWYSEDEKIATVKDGKIKAQALGKTRIYVITQNNEYIYMNVSVDRPKSVAVNEIILSEKEIEVGMYGTYQLNVEIKPEDATNKKLQWSSSNPKVAMVDDNGLVTGLTSGKATISVRSSNGLVKNCEVRVSIVELEEILLNYYMYNLHVGETVDLDVIFKPENASIKDVKWTTSDVFIADVDAAGIVEAKEIGTTTITVTSKNGKTASCIITVVE